MAAYRILALDGGGIRGYLTILLLEQLAKERPGFLGQIASHFLSSKIMCRQGKPVAP